MRLLCALLLTAGLVGSGGSLRVETLESIGGLPAHAAGRFTEIAACAATPAGDYFVFDRRQHAVFRIPPPYDAPVEIVRIGPEAGRILVPQSFALADDGSFVVADVPENRGRIQVFLASGASVGGFTLPGRELPIVVMENRVVSGLASLAYTGQSILVSQPETGALISEYSLDGRTVRSFGALRATGHEEDRALHLALNAGIPVVDPRGGFYFVFLGGVPLFRKYDATGALLFERHIEGPELDDYVRTMPTTWRRSAEAGEAPIVAPAVRTAAADADGNLWISLMAPVTYVYDDAGDKRRIVSFHAAGTISPRAFFFTRDRVLVAPGCYAFPLTASDARTPRP